MGVEWLFQGCQGYFKYVLRKLQGCFKSTSEVFKRKFQKWSKQVSRCAMVFHGWTYLEFFKRVLQEFLRKFFFAMLLLYGDNLSYPSRKRARSFSCVSSWILIKNHFPMEGHGTLSFPSYLVSTWFLQFWRVSVIITMQPIQIFCCGYSLCSTTHCTGMLLHIDNQLWLVLSQD